MKEKVCFKCNTKYPLSNFYEHKQMADGHINKCKSCTKIDVKGNVRRVCVICNKEFTTSNTEIKRRGGGGYCCSRKCFFARLRIIIKKDKDSPNWKGDKVGRTALHNWVERHLGRPKKCEHCGTTKSKKFEWSNKSQEYKRELTDWQRLCTKCHSKYDYQTRYPKWRASMIKSGRIKT